LKRGEKVDGEEERGLGEGVMRGRIARIPSRPTMYGCGLAAGFGVVGRAPVGVRVCLFLGLKLWGASGGATGVSL
jgi:hypothetical protein